MGGGVGGDVSEGDALVRDRLVLWPLSLYLYFFFFFFFPQLRAWVPFATPKYSAGSDFDTESPEFIYLFIFFFACALNLSM